MFGNSRGPYDVLLGVRKLENANQSLDKTVNLEEYAAWPASANTATMPPKTTTETDEQPTRNRRKVVQRTRSPREVV